MSLIRKALHRLYYSADIIAQCVRCYLDYSLSLRDIKEMMAECGIIADHSTLHRWVTRLVDWHDSDYPLCLNVLILFFQGGLTMNQIYSLRYSVIAQGFIAVSEFSRKCVHKSVRRLTLISLLPVSWVFPVECFAGTVNNDLKYQLFRDFAENKGVFRPGAIDIDVYNKQGELVGTLNTAAMPDFSSVNSGSSVATLINPQYIVSVKHNRGYTNVSFGDGENRYNIVDRNNSLSLDFHAPRLDKLVTEVTPTTMTAQGAVAGAYRDKERYPIFYRLGSGTQYIKDQNEQLTRIGGAYSWLTGGTVGSLSSYQNGEMISTSSGLVFDYKLNGAMPIYGEAGDSGSPLFAFDAVQNKWVLVGVLTSGNGPGGRGNNWAVIPLEFIGQKFNEDNDETVMFSSLAGVTLEWNFDNHTGIGTLSQGTTEYAMHGQTRNNLNTGKNLIFMGHDGQIDLKNSVSQGAGSLTFRDDYTVTTTNDSTWIGAGIIVDRAASVTWQVNGVKGDNLHKIGEGTLIVQGTGANEGGLKIGDGKVVLNQQVDSKGLVQAFSSVNIASGRPTVVLTNDRQVNPDTVSWGYRGGSLDVNGNSLTFHQLKAADYGAVLENNADKRATITLDYSLKASDVTLNRWSGTRVGTAGTLYKYDNPYTKTTDYFILKQSTYGYFPTDQSSNATWEFVGHNQGGAQKLVADRFNAAGYLFHGQWKGNLDVENRLPDSVIGSLVMDGSADMLGTFIQENGRLTLQGHPVIHAYNSQSVADKLAASGDSSVLTQPTSFIQEDWENRSFTFGQLSLKNTDFGLSRNAVLNTVIDTDNSSITLGDSRVFIDKKDGDGIAFSLEEGISDAVQNSDRSVFNGSVILKGGSQLRILNSSFSGDITGDMGTSVQLGKNGIWKMNKNSSLDSFSSQAGILSFITDQWQPKTLTINTLNASNLSVYMGISAADSASDQINILNQATGGDNILNLTSLLDQGVVLKKDLILASAPTGTPYNYFSFASLDSGFTVYTPDTQVQENNGRVLWKLKHHADQIEPQVPEESYNATGGDIPSHISPEQSNEGNTVSGNDSINGGHSADSTVPGDNVPDTPSDSNMPADVQPPISPGQRHDGNTVSGNDSINGGHSADSMVPGDNVPDTPSDSNIPADVQPPTSPGQRHDGNTYSGNNTVSGGQDGDTSLPESHLPISSDTNNVEKDASASISSDKGHDPHSESEGGGISTTHSGDVLVSDNPELDENKGVTVDGNSLFKKVDNAALLKKARAMFTSREFILSDSADRWQQVIDNNETENGIWAITGYRHGGYEAFTINQSGLNVGFRQSGINGVWWGIGTELYRGYSRADDYSDDFSMWGADILAGKQFDGSLFLDGMVGYRKLVENFVIKGELSDLSGKVKSNIFTAGIRTGWKAYFDGIDMTVTPSVSLNSIRTGGNRLQGLGRKVDLHGGGAIWLKTGLEVEKKYNRLTLKTGLWRISTLNSLPEITLSDDWKARHYDAKKADRYTVSFGINGKLTEKLSVHAKVNSSFDGYFKTDAEGILSILYNF